MSESRSNIAFSSTILLNGEAFNLEKNKYEHSSAKFGGDSTVDELEEEQVRKFKALLEDYRVAVKTAATRADFARFLNQHKGWRALREDQRDIIIEICEMEEQKEACEMKEVGGKGGERLDMDEQS